MTPVKAAKVPVTMDDVQGIILRGYEKLPLARFVMLKIGDPAAARVWLKSLSGEITSARTKPTARAVNVAFTHAGLEQFGLPQSCLNGFAEEFIEGMDTPHRNRVLGDTDDRTPKTWDWGKNEDSGNIHILLMLYADADVTLRTLIADHEKRCVTGGLVPHPKGLFDPLTLTGRKEHFGFRDGISQPFVEGVTKEPPTTEREQPVPENTIPAGEFLLGYSNGYGVLPPSPMVAADGANQAFDFGNNGSYLVVRQLSQDVKAFWSYLMHVAGRPGPNRPEDSAAVELASRMVGRWPNGAPLAVSPNEDNPLFMDEDKFAFENDPLGLKTPIGAHTRRSNPRDSLEPGPGGEGRLSAATSLAVTNLHRIIRRGRPYGPPVAASMDPVDIVRAIPTDPYPAVDRGLLFLCFNANIARQFEFIQQTWINNPKFGGLYEDTDPLMGHRHPTEMSRPADVFTRQAEPVRRRYPGLPDFVRVRGGGYFFMPGLKALEYLGRA
jgi:Dyp-type peroxidase family